MSSQPNFESLLAAAQEGAEWAWRAIYDDVAGPLAGYLRVRGAADPEDLVGEVLLQLARNIKTFQGDEAEFRSWVFLVAHHRLIDERRARSRRPQPADAADDLDLPSDDDVEAAALERLSSEEVRELFEVLTPDQRDVLALRIIADLDVSQTARIVDKRPGAVRALQHRAIQALRQKINRET